MNNISPSTWNPPPYSSIRCKGGKCEVGPYSTDEGYHSIGECNSECESGDDNKLLFFFIMIMLMLYVVVVVSIPTIKNIFKNKNKSNI